MNIKSLDFLNAPNTLLICDLFTSASAYRSVVLVAIKTMGCFEA